MPYPDYLSPEIWHYIVSIASIGRSELIPWLQISPYVYAKGMHDAAFARLFRRLDIFISANKYDIQRATELISRHAKETALLVAVRDLRVQWDLFKYLGRNLDTDFMTEIEQLLCEFLVKLERLQNISWFTNPGSVLTPLPEMKDALYRCISRHYATLRSLTLSGFNFRTLDLSTATSISKLNLEFIRLSSSSSFVAIPVDTMLDALTLRIVECRDGSQVDILGSFNLSGLKTLNLACRKGIGPADVSHLSRAGRLVSLQLTHCDRISIGHLANCCPFPTLHQLSISIGSTEIPSAAHAEEVVMDLSTFISKQTSLRALEIGFMSSVRIINRGLVSSAFDAALGKEYFLRALFGLKELRRLSLAACKLDQHPVHDLGFAAALPRLRSLTVKAMTEPIITEEIVNRLADCMNRYPNLHAVDIQIPAGMKRMAKSLPSALKIRAPRVTCCILNGRYFRLTRNTARIREIATLYPDVWVVSEDQDLLP